jgi:histidinol phosphatase-like PHP family hydrolase
MIDLHTHTFLSDGVLLPSELIRRAEVRGYRAIALTDHVAVSNLDFVVPRLVRLAAQIAAHVRIRVLAGAEITHAPPAMIAALTQQARQLGATLVVVHGETPVEPVAPGTNRAAIEAGVDILAHPGLITAEDASLAARRGVRLEITARRGHCLTNGHVALAAKAAGAQLVLNTDAHEPGDLIDLAFARTVALGAGLGDEDFEHIQRQTADLLARLGFSPA